ncbi:MAG: hypothetical protein WCO54_08240 [Bacteroidota bacterium]
MLYEESVWFKENLSKHIKEQSLVLNIGSSTKYFIEVEQPYIKKNIFDVLESKNCVVKNIDIKQAEGVDLIGDVTDASFVAKLKQMNPAAIICSNLLEHLEERKTFCDALVKIMNDETLLFVSVPYSFPYHEDPIDTLFRPDLKELQNTFPSLKLLEGTIVDCGNFFSYSNKHLNIISQFINFVKIILAIIPASFINKTKFKRLLWNFKNISATCAIYKLN